MSAPDAFDRAFQPIFNRALEWVISLSERRQSHPGPETNLRPLCASLLPPCPCGSRANG